MSFKKYLEDTKKHLSDGFKDKEKVHVVLCNESCDLDSAVSCLVKAYFLYYTSKSTETVTVIAVLNIPYQKYHLRTEVVFLLGLHDIDIDLLTFSDQIDLKDLHKQGKLILSLIDHNVLTGKYTELEDCVISVTDHRPQVRKPDDRVTINISPVGSCCTLIAEELLKQEEFTPDKVVLKFLYATILIDTVNLNPAAHKMTDRDVNMVDKLKERLPDVNGDELYNSVHKAKSDIQGLTTLDLLEKDLKIVSGSKIKVAMSSVSISLQDFLSRENLLEDLKSFSQHLTADALIMMMIHEISPRQPARDIAIFCCNPDLQRKICNSLIQNKEPDLELEHVQPFNDTLVTYHQGCVRASRKQVLPVIQSAVIKYETSADQSNNSSTEQAKPLDAVDLLNPSGTTSAEQLHSFDPFASLPDQSSQNQFEYGSFSDFQNEGGAGPTETDNSLDNPVLNCQSDSTDLTNFNLLNNTEGTEQVLNNQMSSNLDLVGSLDLFGTSINQMQDFHENINVNIPEISINNSDVVDEFNDADIMFHSSNFDFPNSGRSSVSQVSSAHTSEPGSAFASYPITPPNSFIDSSGILHMKDFTLPSLNSAEMLEKIREKKGRLRSTESTSADVTDNEGNSVPYTPQNSFMDGTFEQYAKDHQLPSFNSMEMVQRIKQKRSSMEMSRLEEEDDMVKLRSESGELTPFTPPNSFRDLTVLDKNAREYLDTDKLQQTLQNIQLGTIDLVEEVDESSPAVKERTNSGLLIFDMSNTFNPTTIDNNVVAVGLAQEMIKRETTEDDLVSFDEASSDGGNRLTDSNSSNFEEKPSSDNANNGNNTENFQSNSHIPGDNDGKSCRDTKNEDLLLLQSIDEYAQNLTGKLIEEAINTFPGYDQSPESEDMTDMSDNTTETEESIEHPMENRSKINPVSSLELVSPSSGTVMPLSPEEVPIETDYLPSVDPLRGNLDLQEDNQEIIESISFRKISGEEPQTVRQEILQQNSHYRVDEVTAPTTETSCVGVDGYASQLVQKVILSAIATVTAATTSVNTDTSDSTSDITEESGVTWSREASFDTVSSIRSKDGKHITWSNQGSIETPRSSIDKNSGAASFDSDEILLLTHGRKSFDTQDSNEDPSSTSSLDDFSEPRKENQRELKDITDSVDEDVDGESNLNEKEKNNLSLISKTNLSLDFKEADTMLSEEFQSHISSSYSHENEGNFQKEMNENIPNSDILTERFKKVEAEDYISSENETDSLLQLKSENVSLLNQAEHLDQNSVPYNFRKIESLDYISSEGETDNIVQLQREASDFVDNQTSRPTYQKADTLDYISSEGEGQETHFIEPLPGMYSSQSSEPTSTTTEGSYQVLSPDQHFSEIKGEITDMIKTEMKGEVIQMISDIKKDTNFTKNENDVLYEGKSNSNLFSTEKLKDNVLSENNEIMYQGKFSHELEKSNLDKVEISVFEDLELDTDQINSKDMKDKKKEIYMTSAGRISIASDGDTESLKQRISVTDKFIEETHLEDELTEKPETKETDDSSNTETRDREPEPKETEQKTEDSINTDTNNKESETEDKKVKDTGQTVTLEPAEQPVNFERQHAAGGTDKPKVAQPGKKGMDFTEEWHEDPIPGMNVDGDDSDSSDSRSRHSSGSSDSSDSTRPANRPTSLQTKKKKKISANFNILKEDYTAADGVENLDNAGDLEWENDTPVSIPSEPLPEYSAEDEYQDAKHWRGVEVNGKQQKIDLRVIDPYKKFLSHGGYYGDGLNAIIVFSGCYLPDRNRKDYSYVMDNLFLYVISTLELLVAEDYMIVYFHGATPRRQMPSFGWLKRCYQMIDRRLKKNLKGLLLIHPTLWLRTIVIMTKPFISTKFSSKLKFVRTLNELSKIVPMEYIFVPDQVQKYDSNLIQPPRSSASSSSSAPHTPP